MPRSDPAIALETPAAPSASSDFPQDNAWKDALDRSLREVFEFFRFIDWVIELPRELTEKLKTEVHEYQEKKRMPYISTWERLVMEDGARNLLLSQLEFKIGTLDEKIKGRIEKLEQPELNALGKDLFSFNRLQDLTKWLTLHTKKRATVK